MHRRTDRISRLVLTVAAVTMAFVATLGTHPASAAAKSNEEAIIHGHYTLVEQDGWD